MRKYYLCLVTSKGNQDQTLEIITKKKIKFLSDWIFPPEIISESRDIKALEIQKTLIEELIEMHVKEKRLHIDIAIELVVSHLISKMKEINYECK